MTTAKTRIFVEKRPEFRTEAESLRRELNSNLGLDIKNLRLLCVYDLFGFTPELVVDDSTIYPGDFGTSDDILSNMAINWANSGVKPSTGSKATTLSGQRVRTLRSSDEMQSPLSRRQGGSIMKLDR